MRSHRPNPDGGRDLDLESLAPGIALLPLEPCVKEVAKAAAVTAAQIGPEMLAKSWGEDVLPCAPSSARPEDL
ncbi:hypothetical protein ZWY2020_019280 [Hordeum vulgare]|nr:hypothetical protein ZWY2020_019280 [Hordeum vulgare]